MKEQQAPKLSVVHVCSGCGTASRHELVNDDAKYTGVAVCPTCGHSGPLNVKIDAAGESTPLT